MVHTASEEKKCGIGFLLREPARRSRGESETHRLKVPTITPLLKYLRIHLHLFGTMYSCYSKECSKSFASSKALSAHVSQCVLASTAFNSLPERMRGLVGSPPPRKQCRTSLSSHENLPIEDGRLLDVDSEVSYGIYAPQFMPTHVLGKIIEESAPPAIEPLNIPETPQESSSTRPKRTLRALSRYADMVATSRTYGPSFSHMPSFKTKKQLREEAEAQEAERRANLPPSPPRPHSPTPVMLETFETTLDEFGRYRVYTRLPQKEILNDPQPDHNDFPDSMDVHQESDDNVASGLRMPSVGLSDLTGLLGVFLNTTVALLVNWFYSGTSLKSLADIQSLIDTVILHEDFNPEDLQGVNINKEIKKLDAFESSREGMGWKEGSVKIRVPCPGHKQDELTAEEFEVEGVLYQDLVDIVISACQDANAVDSLHTTPFKEMWKRSEDAAPIRLYGEAYTSDEMLEAYEEVQNVPPDPGHPDVENVVIEMLIYSDATRLAQFGTASIWPVYFFLGNISKYIRCQPSSKSAHHGAYFPTVSLLPHSSRTIVLIGDIAS